ncbi:acetyltransferase [Bifidobacterium pullorum subsp. saeculare DSM 6531 = LMG 14934]|uniref:Acetyltransferase n=2 Tax=Bifidobacterium pullorum TaxID=78448 RepID=A0A087CTF2_9BIFI|nr:acetyltransferase [Bifidobacterium pullorum subsp. saeculare DSM 6531 = LMG 14934]
MSLMRKLSHLNRETIRLKWRSKVAVPLLQDRLRSELEVTDFTIISNNCWGGMVYESYGLKKMSPTVGMFIMPEDFVRFCANLPSYLGEPLVFLKPEQSKWIDTLRNKDDWGTYLIGCIGDVELHMLHYHDEDTARRKWEARVKRVNYERILYKINDQNGATEQELLAFDALPLEHKVAFSVQEHPKVSCCIRFRCPQSHEFIHTSYEPFGHNRTFDVTKYLNSAFGTPFTN